MGKNHILLTIGKATNKRKLLPFIKKAYQPDRVVFYATQKTHRFLKAHQVESTLVYKISQDGQPNLVDLLNNNIFQVIINIPSRNKLEELTDGKIIRKAAIEQGITLITDMEVASEFLNHVS